MIRALIVAFLLAISSPSDAARNFRGPGNDDFLAVSSVPLTATPATVVAWIKPDTASPSQIGSIWWIGTDDDDNFTLRYETGTEIRWVARAGGSGGAADTTANYTVNEWNHVAAVGVASDDRAVFLDGGNKGTNTADITPNASELIETVIGIKRNPAIAGRFSGDIGHVAVWDVALTDQEIATLALGVSPLRVHRDNLIAYWPINGQSPEVDIVGGLNMTLNGPLAIREEPPIPHSIVAP